MFATLRDMYKHQAWADAEHWRAIAAYPAARDDTAIRDRLHHIHLVQRAFLWMVGDRAAPFERSKPEDFASPEQLRVWGQEYHDEIARFLDSASDGHLDAPIVIPWFQDPPLSLTRAEALTQCAMHSHYHRGQNAARLRALGGEPPSTDLIVWFWKGRPAAQWP